MTCFAVQRSVESGALRLVFLHLGGLGRADALVRGRPPGRPRFACDLGRRPGIGCGQGDRPAEQQNRNQRAGMWEP